MNEPPLTPLTLWRRRLQSFALRVRSLLPFGLGIFATLIGLLLYNQIFPPPAPLTITEVSDNVAEAIAAVTPAPSYSSLVYQVVQPSLVLIQTRIPGEDDEEGNGIGSGVVISTDGDILTSLHVVDGASDILLTFAEGTQSSAQIVATQPENDIAVLRADRPPALLIPAVLGNPNAMRIGDEAFVVGHPLGLYGSMSTGVISGFDRTFRPTNSEQRIEGLIQIDAAVNPGNSGGPLLNRSGQVVGIVAGLVNPTDNNFFIGIGFAVPIDIAGAAAGLPPY